VTNTNTDFDLIQSIADGIIYFLKSQGFTIQRYDSSTTNSVYLKLDFGASNSVRISDHPGKSHLQYRYNVLLRGDDYKEDNTKTYPMYFYNEKTYCDMLCFILKAKQEKLEKYTRRGYNRLMRENNYMNKDKVGFWQDAKII
jgi:hypothetical protein